MANTGRVVGVALAVLLLAGCSAPTSIAYATYDRAPAGFDSGGGLLNGEPGASWLIGQKSFAIVTFGSSSCPPIPVELTAEPPSAMTLRFVPSQNQPCTADLRATTHQFYLPEGMDVASRIDITIVWDFPQPAEYHVELEPGP